MSSDKILQAVYHRNLPSSACGMHRQGCYKGHRSGLQILGAMPGAVDRLCSQTTLFRDQPFEYSNFTTMDFCTTIFTVWSIPLLTGLVVSCWFTLVGRRHAPQSKESEAWALKTFSDLSRGVAGFCGGLIAVILGGGISSSLVWEG